MAAIIGNRNITLGVLGGTLITAACYSGGEVFGYSPYDAATTRYLMATYPGHWQAIRNFGFDNPSAVPFINANPEAFHAFMDYVQDGLVFQLDHTIMCSAAQWTDRIGNVAFVGQNVQLQDGVPYFNGSNAFYRADSLLSWSPATHTIEVIYIREVANTRYIITGGTNSYMIGWYNNGYVMVSNGAGSKSYPNQEPIGTFATMYYAANPANCYINKVKQTSWRGSDYWDSADTKSCIGSRGGSSCWQGKIFAIRIYNRLLTEQEILQNQAADLARWNTN